MESPEVTEKIQRMFPVSKVYSNILYDEGLDYFVGFCNDRLSTELPNYTVGLLSDIDLLEKIRSSDFYDKLIVIASKSYFTFHGRDSGTVGFVITPKWQPDEPKTSFFGLIKSFQFEWEGENLGGSWNIAFVRSDQDNKGTVSHELAHTLGQGRELYESNERCQQFRGDPLEVCKNYIIPRALEATNQSWKVIKNKHSIVSDEGGRIADLWIDRDTFQKNFWLASHFPSLGIDPWVDLFDEADESRRLKNRKSSLKAVVSGFYYEEEEAFIIPTTTVYKTTLKTMSFPSEVSLPLLSFQLKEGEELLKEIKRPVFQLDIELLYENEISETRPFPFSHAMASFQLPEDYEKRNLNVFVFSPKGKLIYSATVSKMLKETEK